MTRGPMSKTSLDTTQRKEKKKKRSSFMILLYNPHGPDIFNLTSWIQYDPLDDLKPKILPPDGKLPVVVVTLPQSHENVG